MLYKSNYFINKLKIKFIGLIVAFENKYLLECTVPIVFNYYYFNHKKKIMDFVLLYKINMNILL